MRRLLSITPVPFEHVFIDATSGGRLTFEKALGDIDGDGKLDAIIGYDNSRASPGGIVWYQFPHSGKPQDHWNRYTIVPGGKAYEAVKAYDVKGTGHMDVIASYNGSLLWFENPADTGGNPTSDTWAQHYIGPDAAHEMALADFDGDGRIDIATQRHIFFQNADPAAPWTVVSAPQYDRGQVGVADFDSGSGNGSIDLAGVGTGPDYPLVWFQNPRDIGGNPRTDTWATHTIGPNYIPGDATVWESFATTDVNGDGRMDVITANGEGGDLPFGVSPPGGLIWWEAPADRINGTWVPHTIDAGVRFVHQISLADVNGDGHTDIVFSEQEQAPGARVGVYYNVDGTGNNWQLEVLSTTSGHNQTVGDVLGNGNIDILNAGHGQYTGYAPIELYLNLRGVSPSLPSGWSDADIGVTSLAGSASSANGSEWAVSGSGADIGGSADAFNFAGRNVMGDATITTQVTSIGPTDQWAKAGVMLRASADLSAPFADIVTTPFPYPRNSPSTGVDFEWRSTFGGQVQHVQVTGLTSIPQWLRLVRTGNMFSAFYSDDAIKWNSAGPPQAIAMPAAVRGGLAVNAHNDNGALNTATFGSVSIVDETPVPAVVVRAPATFSGGVPSQAVAIGQMAAANGKPARFSFKNSDGTLVTLTLSRGSAQVFRDAQSNQIDLWLSDTDATSTLNVQTRGGANHVVFDAVQVDGSLGSFVARGATLAGTFSVGGSLGALTLGTAGGTVAVASTIGRVDAATIDHARILSGVKVSAGASSDVFSSGSIDSVNVSGAIISSVVAAGIDPGPDGIFGTADDQSSGGKIGRITARSADPASRFVVARFGRADLPRRVNVAVDGRFFKV